MKNILKLYTNIKNERIKHGWTQTDLAQKIGYSDKSMIAKIEAGKIDLSQTKIRDFANVFNCTESYLMGWEEQEEEFTLTEKEIEALKIFRNLDAESQRQLVLMLAFLKDQNNNK